MGESNMIRSLSIMEWHRLALADSAPPIRITLNGGSMHPLIRWNRDHVTITAMEKEPIIGDIVLFCEPGTGRYVVHRVWDIKNGMVLTWGDNCSLPDGWLPQGAIWGKVVKIERGKQIITPNAQKGVLWAKIWHHGGKLYRFFHRVKSGLLRRIKTNS